MFWNRLMPAALSALLGLQLGACATVFEGTTQPITVNTGTVADVDCKLTSPAFGTLSMKAPGVVTVEKSKHNINVNCTKEGYEPGQAVIVSHFAAAAAANILFGLSGIVVGGLVDAASGAGNKYDSQVNVTMAAKPEPEPVPADPRRARRTARVEPPKPTPAASTMKAEPPKPEAPKVAPMCREVGGYEAYKQKTGEICRI
jgi:hypothetical protein